MHRPVGVALKPPATIGPCGRNVFCHPTWYCIGQRSRPIFSYKWETKWEGFCGRPDRYHTRGPATPSHPPPTRVLSRPNPAARLHATSMSAQSGCDLSLELTLKRRGPESVARCTRVLVALKRLPTARVPPLNLLVCRETYPSHTSVRDPVGIKHNASWLFASTRYLNEARNHSRTTSHLLSPSPPCTTLSMIFGKQEKEFSDIKTRWSAHRAHQIQVDARSMQLAALGQNHHGQGAASRPACGRVTRSSRLTHRALGGARQHEHHGGRA